MLRICAVGLGRFRDPNRSPFHAERNVLSYGMSDSLEEVAKLLRDARGVLFITGAGLSADSGLPTYRGVGGLYEGQATEDGMRIDEALSGVMLERRPELTWKYLWQIGEACREAKPNRGHEVIAEVERDKPESWVLTQNIDGLHRAAGTRNLIEIHGGADNLFCMRCGYECTAEDFISKLGSQDLPQLPRCPECENVLRPNVVLFGEFLPEEALEQMLALQDKPLELVFSVGTSALFPYISQPVEYAKSIGIPTVEINPAESSVSKIVDYRIESGAAEVLDQLWKRVKSDEQ